MPPAASSTHEGFFAEAIVTVPSALSEIAQRWAPVPLRELLDVAPGPGRAALDVERQPRFRVGYLVSTGMRVVSEAKYLGGGPVRRPELDVCAGVERA